MGDAIIHLAVFRNMGFLRSGLKGGETSFQAACELVTAVEKGGSSEGSNSESLPL